MRRFVGLCLALTACGSSKSDPATSDAATDAAPKQIAMPTGDPMSWPVDQPGPFNVGHRAIETSYVPPGETAMRTIPVELWYPTLDAEGENPKYLEIFGDTDVFEDASTAPSIYPGGTYPVHVYSHGHMGFPGTSSDMAHWFASHGWVYVAPAHTGNTLGSPDARPVWMYYARATDLSAALDAVEKLPASDPLAGKLRTKHVLLSGHSYGAYTSWVAGGASFDTKAIQAKCDAGAFPEPCKPAELAVFAKGVSDPRFVAVIPMAGGDVDYVATVDDAKRPFLVMSGTADVSAQPYFDKATTLDTTWIELQGGCHQVFALGGCGMFDEKLGWKLTNTWAFAFGRRYVLGDASKRTTDILTNAAPLSDKIVFHHKGATTPPMGP